MKHFGDFLLAHANILNRLGTILHGILAELPINSEHKNNLSAEIDKVVAHGDVLIEVATSLAATVAPGSFTTATDTAPVAPQPSVVVPVVPLSAPTAPTVEPFRW